MTDIDYTNFRKSLKNLEVQHENMLNLPGDVPEYMREGMIESVIKRFEICYETLWKVLRRYLIDELGLANVPGSPRPILRMAAENLLLTSGSEQWMRYVDARIDTTHRYSGEQAAQAVGLVRQFIRDAISLHTAMTGEPWD